MSWRPGSSTVVCRGEDLGKHLDHGGSVFVSGFLAGWYYFEVVKIGWCGTLVEHWSLGCAQGSPNFSLSLPCHFSAFQLCSIPPPPPP